MLLRLLLVPVRLVLAMVTTVVVFVVLAVLVVTDVVTLRFFEEYLLALGIVLMDKCMSAWGME